MTRGGQGFKGQYYLTERLKPESVPQTRSPYQWESPTSPDTSYTPWAADPPGILSSLSAAAASTVSRRCAWPALLAFPSASLCAQGGRARGSGTPTAAPPLPSHFMATRRKTWSVVCSRFSVTQFSARFFFFFKLQSRLQFQTSKTPSPEKKQIPNYQVIFFLSPDIFSPSLGD